jgi:hypothetical protein
MRCAREGELGADESRLYELVRPCRTRRAPSPHRRAAPQISRQFLASVSPDCVFNRTKVTLLLGTEVFSCEARKVVAAGWTDIVPAKVRRARALPFSALG